MSGELSGAWLNIDVVGSLTLVIEPEAACRALLHFVANN